MQNFLVQATYWHDPLNEEKYKNYSSFLSDINNERTINRAYVTNLQSLERYVFNLKYLHIKIIEKRIILYYES